MDDAIGTQKPSVKFRLNLLFAIALIIIMGINVISLLQIKKLINANKIVVHTYQIIQTNNEILLSILDAESLVRLYLITSDNHHLKNLDTLTKKANIAYDHLIQLKDAEITSNNLLKSLKELLDKRIQTFHKTIAIKNNNNLNSTEGLATMQKGQDITNQIKTILLNLNEYEFNQLSVRTQEIRNSWEKTSISIALINLINIILLILIILLFNKKITESIRAEKNINKSQSLLKGIIDGSSDFIAALDLNYNIIAFNQAFSKEVNKIFNKNITRGMNLKELFTNVPSDETNALEIWARALKGEKFTVTGKYGDPALDRNEYEITFSPIYDDKNKIIGASHIARNVNKRIAEQKALLVAKEETEEILTNLKKYADEISAINNMTSILQSATSLDETISLVLNHCKKLLKFTSGTLYLINPSKNYLEAVGSWNSPKKQESIFPQDDCWGLRQGKPYRYVKEEVNLKCKHVKDLNLSIYMCIPLLAQHDIIGLLYLEFINADKMSQPEIELLTVKNESLINNISGHVSLAIANIKLREALKARSIRDPLTGLFNRAFLMESLEKDFPRARHDNIPLAVVMMDLDYFKMINDSYGHEAGDILLKEIGRLLKFLVAKQDVVCRYGGEEFLIIYYNTDEKVVLERVEQIRKEIYKLEIFYGGALINSITASFGIAIFPQHGDEPKNLIQLADEALYHSKKTGRNKVSIYGKY